MEPGRALIGKVRYPSADPDRFGVQFRLASNLSALDLQPAGLAPSVILVIRQLRDPLPGRFLLDKYQLSNSWAQKLNQEVGRLAQQAVRPALGSVPPTANAVVFADRAELLACLARDWIAGTALTHWWWRNLFRTSSATDVMPVAWQETPEYVPAALHHLARSGEAVPFIRALDSPIVWPLLLAVARHFGLYSLRTIFEDIRADKSLTFETGGRQAESPAVPQATAQVQPERSGSNAPEGEPTLSALGVPTIAPWQAWIVESARPDLRFEQHGLLGIALMLIRRPADVRTHAFARSVRRWVENINRPADGRQQVITPRPSTIRSAEPELPTPMFEEAVDSPGDTSVTASPSIQEQAEAPRAVERPAETSSIQQEITPQAERQPAQSLVEREKSIQDSEATAEVSLVEQSTAPIETALGGIFYLVNVALSLNLYSDFTTPDQPGIDLPIWDFLTLVGERLLGDPMRADPIWSLLATLAGRDEQTPPGQAFEPPDEWRLPPEWLAAFPESDEWLWTLDQGRLRVRHPEQFTVLDVRSSGDPQQHLLTELQPYNTAVHLRRQDAAMETWSDAPLDRWLAWLVPFVKARLKRALDMTDDIPRLLLRHRAQVFVTTTRLDIVLSLDELPIEIRIAGLDCDPGWVPAAGRFIAFHFKTGQEWQ